MIKLGTVQKLVHRINPNVKVKLGNFHPYSAFVERGNGDTIFIDWRWFKYTLNRTKGTKKNPKPWQNDEHRLIGLCCLMFHELGHIHHKHFNMDKNKPEMELDAQLWGLKLAKKMGLAQVYEEMKADMEITWANYSLKSPYKIYKQAWNLLKKKKNNNV